MNKKQKFKIIFPFSYLSNVIAAFVGFCSILLMGALHQTFFGVALSLTLATSLLLQRWFFNIQKKKESQLVDSKWLKKKYKMTPKQLDHFVAYMYKLSSISKVLFFAAGILFPANLELIMVFFVALPLVYWTKAYLIKSGQVKGPHGKYVLKKYSPSRSDNGPRGIDLALQAATGITQLRSRH